MTSQRSVARPVSNLGNTCYMNAVLQALAHAPELCLAMDCEPHHLTCPVAAENALKRTEIKNRSCSPSASPEDTSAAMAIQDATFRNSNSKQHAGTRKSSRRLPGGRKSPRATIGGGDADSATSGGSDLEFCALCEVEHHIRQVHDASQRDKPVAPSAFVNGFIDHVAPWFHLGVQEDSHEFLRLLIDAMQKSCQRARLQDNPQDVSPRGREGEEQGNDFEPDNDHEYPFSLFRGTVESNVVCGSCKASSSTLDPIEDVGLEVTLPQALPPASFRHSVHPNSSRNTSPIPSALTDVQTAFQRFAQTEALDSGYKCEKCGKVGRATKQSRLASIPPILTLHLKRFRYGDRVVATAPTGSRRSCRSEVSQLLGNNEFSTGKSGSAKIEGHIKFDMFFDLKPYLTDNLKAKHSNMFCRLFAVIVHAGKNSHSGHYIAFVRNVGMNEWWKMDDSRVVAVTVEEVMQAEAYMLFYRVVQHPVAIQLEDLHKKNVRQELSRRVNAVVPIVASVLTAKNRKRPPVVGSMESGEDWARKTNFPPHLMGLIQKVTDLIADDIQISSQYYNAIGDEASLPNAAVAKGPVLNIMGGKSRDHCCCEPCVKNYVHSSLPFSFNLIRKRRRRWNGEVHTDALRALLQAQGPSEFSRVVALCPDHQWRGI